MEFNYRGNSVTVVQTPVQKWGEPFAIQTAAEYKRRFQEVKVFREVIRVARKSPDATATIRQYARDGVIQFRKRLRTPKAHQFNVNVKVKRNDKKLKTLFNLYTLKYGRVYTFTEQTFTLSHNFSPIVRAGYIRGEVRKFEDRIRMVRRELKKPEPQHRSFYVRSLNTRISYTTVGGTFTEPGTILRLARELRSKAVFMSKYPTNTNRHVAVEIECFGPLTQTELGIKVYEAGLAKYVHVKGDGSIRTNKSSEHAYELAVLAEATEFKDVIKRLSDLLVASECKVNKSCGLHVHLDTRTHDANKMFSNLVSAQNILYKMQPQSRRDNSYCKPTSSKSLRIERSKGNRYLGINPMSYSRHNTIEVRLHSGTIDAVKINNFVTILESVAYSSQETKRGASTVKGFAKQYGLPAWLAAYIEMRITKFAGAEVLEESA